MGINRMWQWHVACVHGMIRMVCKTARTFRALIGVEMIFPKGLMYKKVGLSQSSLCETPSSINRMATPVVTAPVDVQPLGTRDSVHSYERGRCYFRHHV
jgi:hypothetical protein